MRTEIDRLKSDIILLSALLRYALNVIDIEYQKKNDFDCSPTTNIRSIISCIEKEIERNKNTEVKDECK